MKNSTNLIHKKISRFSLSLFFSFLLIVYSVNSIAQTGCTISKTNCPPALAQICTTNSSGANATWSPPLFSYSCSTGGSSGYAFTMSFDLPESQNNCWIYNKVQRIGTSGGRLRLWQSSGGSPDPYFETPSFFFPTTPTDCAITLTNGSGQTITCSVYFVDGNNNVSPLVTSFTGSTGLHNFTIAPSTAGVYRLKFVFTGNGNNSDYVELLQINSSLFGSACSADIDFATTSDHNPGDLFTVGSTPVTYTAVLRDASGSIIAQDSCSFSVVVNSSPTITSATSATDVCYSANAQNTSLVYSNPSNSPTKYSVVWNASPANSFVPVTNATLSGSPISLSVPANTPAGTYTGNLTVNNANGCGSSVNTFTITVKPVTTVNSISNSTYCNGDSAAAINFSGGINGTTYNWTSTSDVGFGTSGSGNIAAFKAINTGVNPILTTVTITPTVNGCQGTPVSFTITVNPTALPTMTAPGNITVACGALPAPSTIPYSNIGTCIINGTSNLSTFTSTPGVCGGTVTETWTAKDALGRTLAPVSRTITISPAALPTMIAPADITVTCGALPAPSTISFSNGLTGGCAISGISNSSTFSTTPNACGGTVTETWTATDSCGRALASVSRIITVSPAALPTMTAPPAITVACGALPAAGTISFDNGLTGGCNISGTSNLSTFSATPNACGGTVTETWTATDSCGRGLVSVSRIITVNPADLPTMVAPSSITVACGALPAPSSIPFSNGMSGGCKISGNSNLSTFSTIPNNCGGTVTETWTATDSCGRALAPVSRTIIVSPATLPTMTAPSAITVACGALPSPSSIPFSNGMTGGCKINGSSNPSTFSALPTDCGGTVTETWTATDSCGRALSSVSRIITVSPAALPTMIAPADITVTCGALPAPSTIPFSNGLTGSCLINGTSNLSTFTSTVSGFCNGKVIETWTATDSCGRTLTSVSRTINVKDTTAPIWSTIAGSLDQVVQAGNQQALASAMALAPIATDNCSSVTYVKTSGSFVSGGCLGATGTYTNTWVATDICNNSSTVFSQTITVNDNNPPTWVTVDGNLNRTIECSDAAALVAAQSLAPTFTDNSGSATMTKISGAFVPSGCGASGSYTNTWTAKDACGNASSTFIQIITLQDTTAPVWSTTSGSLNQNIQAGDQQALNNAMALAPVATDNCGNVTYAKTSGSFTTSGCSSATGTYTNTWVAKDACGNGSIVFTQIITVSDTTPPTWVTVAGNLNRTIECSDTAALAAAQGLSPVFNDNSGNAIPTKVSGAFVASGCGASGSYTNTWTAKDACGNTSNTFIQVIKLQDTTAPVWSTTVGSLNQNIQAGDQHALATAMALAPIATDNCNNVTYVKTSGSFATSGCSSATGTYTNTWVATDACSNSSSVFTQIITVSDTTPPAWVTVDGNLNRIIECSDTAALGTAQGLSPVFNDNSGNAISTKVSGAFVASGCGASGSYTNTWTAKDACGNTSNTFTQVITLQDTTAPVWSTTVGSLNQNIQAGDQQALATAMALAPIATDNCNNVTYVKTSGSFATSGCSSATGTYTNTWVATDACSNSSSVFTQIITVSDTTPPAWVTVDGNLNRIIECSDTAALATAQGLAPDFNDNSGNATITKTSGAFVPSGCGASGTYTNTWTAKDACGNISNTFTQVITLQDTTAPVWSTTAGSLDQNIQAGDQQALATAMALAPAATDNCNNVMYAKTTGSFATGGCSGATGTYTNTWVATDACSNASTVFTQIITVSDTTSPTWVTIDGNLNRTIECSDTAALGTAQGLAPDFNDNSGNATITKTSGTFVASGCGASGTYTNTWTAKDACGNISNTFTQVITLQDTTAPVWSTIAGSLDQNVQAADQQALAAAMALAPAATDNCNNVTYAKTSGSFIANGCSGATGTYTNTWVATDSCNNSSMVFTQIITISDSNAPSWVTVGGDLNKTIECSDATALATAQGLAPAFDDNSGNATLTKVSGAFVPSGCGSSGSYTNTWTAKDDCGNTSKTFTQVITLQDTTAPIWSTNVGSLDQNIQAGDQQALAAAMALAPAATDNCNNVTYTKTTGSFANSGCSGATGTYTNTWIATDACSNVSTVFTQIITVSDTTSPTWVTVDGNLNKTIECSDTAALTLAQGLAPDFNDNSGNATITKTSGAFVASGCGASGTYTNTWTAKDDCGNISNTFNQIITLQDTTAPVIAELPAAFTISCTDELVFQQATAIDNCDATVTLTFADVKVPGVCNGTYSMIRTWTATDACGNSSTASQTINVEDHLAPVIAKLPDASTIDCSATPVFAQAVATDQCGSEVTLTYEDVNSRGNCLGATIVTRTWTATDACGNQSTASQIINFEDTTGPTISSPFESTVNVKCSSIPDVPQLQFVDNCSDVANVTYSSVQPTAINQSTGSYVIIREWIATDKCGNSSTFTQTINVTIDDSVTDLTIKEACNGDNSPLILSDYIPKQYQGLGSWIDVNNSGALQSNDGTFNPYQIPIGNYIVDYIINDPQCPRKIELTIPVNNNCIVLGCDDITVHNFFSPNGDGFNDVFEIEHITDSCYLSNKVRIYNRWGSLLFEIENYNNTDRAFRGISDASTTIDQSAELPAGTYYYLLEYTQKPESSQESKTYKKGGYLYLSR